MPVVDLIAALAEEITHHVLARPLGTANGRDGNEIPRGRKLRIEACVDRIQYSCSVIAGIHHAAPIYDKPYPTYPYHSKGSPFCFQNRGRRPTIRDELSFLG